MLKNHHNIYFMFLISVSTIACTPSEHQETKQTIKNDNISSNDVCTIQYSSGTTTGIASVYIPASMRNDTAVPKPLMLLLDPGGNADGIVARWRHAADCFGWIIASTPSIRNGTPDDEDMLHLLALLNSIGTKWSIDKRAVILGGFSGGACGAYRHALERPDLFRGAIVECGHMGPFRDIHDQIRPGSQFFLATRTDDFNAPAMRTLAKALEECGETVRIVELSGGHEPITGADAEEALGWMNSIIR